MLYLRAMDANGSNAGESPSSTMQLFGYGCIPVEPVPYLLDPIHLQRFAEVLIICEGSFQLSAISKNKKQTAEG
jgi:hypothetical protein